MLAYDDDYRIEEHDDERTRDAEITLVEECQKPYKKPVVRDRTEEYYSLFKTLLKEIGKSKEYQGLVENFHKGQNRVDETINQRMIEKRKDLQTTLEDYKAKYKNSVDAAKRTLIQFINLCKELDIEFSYNPDEYFRSLLDSDKRKCHYGSIKYGIKHCEILSPEEIEARYARRLKKRAEKNNKR